MTRDDIVRLAWKASGGILSYDAEGDWRLSEAEVFRFAALVATAEREACAKLCEEYDDGRHANRADLCAAAIRAREQE